MKVGDQVWHVTYRVGEPGTVLELGNAGNMWTHDVARVQWGSQDFWVPTDRLFTDFEDVIPRILVDN